MEKGLWTVEFKTDIGGAGTGTVIFENGRVAGGDAGYYYIGTYNLDQNKITAQAKIQKYNPGHVSVFGPLEFGDLKLTGSITGSSMTGTGRLSQQPTVNFTVIGTKRVSF